MDLIRFPGHFTIFYLVIIKSYRAPLAIGYFVSGAVGTLWSRWPVRRVLVLLPLLPFPMVTCPAGRPGFGRLRA